MKKHNDFVLKALELITWIIFIGLCVEAGALLFNFAYTIFKPIAAHNVYNGLNLSELYQKQFFHFAGLMSFTVVLAVLKAYLFFLLVKVFTKLNLVNPFSIEIAKLIQKISVDALSVAIVSIIATQYTKRLIQSGYEVSHIGKYWNDTSAFLMMAAIIYVISVLFKKGIELQNENDLTV